ncbi:MAG: hypothetical protein ACREJ6_01700 [Candidatus Methylomirabilis sp.]
MRDTISQYNPRATVIESALPLTVDQPGRMAGARVLAVEDGPTLPTAA